MIADLIHDKLKIRLITRNVMSVYSTDTRYTDSFIRTLKHSNYVVNKESVSSDSFVSYVKKNYNVYENVFLHIKHNKEFRLEKFVEYLNFFNLNHLLWVHFYQLKYDELNLIELLMQLSTTKKVVVTNYIDTYKDKDKLYTLVFHVGLEDRLIIIPFRNIVDAVNNSTCQCYVKKENVAKIQATFSNEFINSEFNTSVDYYTRKRPLIYHANKNYIVPSYKYNVSELFLIFLYSIKMTLIALFNWWHIVPNKCLPRETSQTSEITKYVS